MVLGSLVWVCTRDLVRIGESQAPPRPGKSQSALPQDPQVISIHSRPWELIWNILIKIIERHFWTGEKIRKIEQSLNIIYKLVNEGLRRGLTFETCHNINNKLVPIEVTIYSVCCDKREDRVIFLLRPEWSHGKCCSLPCWCYKEKITKWHISRLKGNIKAGFQYLKLV